MTNYWQKFKDWAETHDIMALVNGCLGRIKNLEDSPPGSASFGTISGTPADCSSLQSALNDKLTKGTSTAVEIDTHLGAVSPHSAHATLSGGKVPTTELGGSGASGSTYLRGDQTWATPAGGSGGYAPAFWRPNGLASDATGYQGYTVRTVIGAYAQTTGILFGGTKIKLRLQGASAATATLDHVAIVERSSGADGVTTPTEILFSGASGCVIPAGGFILSDATTFTIAGAGKEYLVIMDFNGSVASSVRREAGNEYQKAATASYNSATLSGSSNYSYLISVVAILVQE